MGEYESERTREKRYQALIRQIRRLDPDVIGVHEANKLPGYAERLASDLNFSVYQHVGVGGVRAGPVGLPWNLREGDAILAKKDLNMQPAGRMQLSGGYVGDFFTFHFDDATQILAVRIENKGASMYVFVTHWHAGCPDTEEFIKKAQELKAQLNFSDAAYQAALKAVKKDADWRYDEAVKTIEFIKKTAGRTPFVLMGDFNAPDDTREIKYLLSNGITDTYRQANPDQPGYTWDPQTNLNQKEHYPLPNVEEARKNSDLAGLLAAIDGKTRRRIDYIFLGNASPENRMTVKSSRVELQEVIDGVHASDHFGIYTEIKFGD